MVLFAQQLRSLFERLTARIEDFLIHTMIFIFIVASAIAVYLFFNGSSPINYEFSAVKIEFSEPLSSEILSQKVKLNGINIGKVKKIVENSKCEVTKIVIGQDNSYEQKSKENNFRDLHKLLFNHRSEGVIQVNITDKTTSLQNCENSENSFVAEIKVTKIKGNLEDVEISSIYPIKQIMGYSDKSVKDVRIDGKIILNTDFGKFGIDNFRMGFNRAGEDKVDLNISTAFDPIIVKNEPQISRTIDNLERYTDQLARYAVALAKNEENTTKLIDKKIEVTDEISGLTEDSSALVRTTENLIKAVEPSAITYTVRNFDRFTDALAANEERKEKLIDKKIEATDAVADLVRDSSAYVQTSKKLIDTINPEDIRQIVNNIRHITKKFKTFVSKLNISLDFVNRLFKHIKPRAITKFFKNIEQIRMTLETQSQDVREIMNDMEDISDEVKNFRQEFIREIRQIKQIIGELEQNTDDIELFNRNLLKIQEKISNLIFLLKSNSTAGDHCCKIEVVGLNMEEVNILISSLKNISRIVELNSENIYKIIAGKGDEFADELTSLVRKLDDFFGTGVDSFLQLDKENGSAKEKFHK